MAEFLSEYGLFLAKALTVLVTVGLLIILAAAAGQRRQRSPLDKGHIVVAPLNDHLADHEQALRRQIDPAGFKAWLKNRQKQVKAEQKLPKDKKKISYLIDFKGDIGASPVASLREEISAILAVATPDDEVIMRLESAGGLVHSYGLAASQLARLRQRGIPLVICVDKVAASGGYMMACLGNRIIAAPFAVLGSIGVVGQIPNFHNLLKKHDIDFELHTAGQHKRNLTLFGENTEEGRQKFIDDLETTHRLFKHFVSEYRPSLAIDEVATGEIWFGTDALTRGLVDDIGTSDDYLMQQAAEREIVHVHYQIKRKPLERLGLGSQEEGRLSGFLSRMTRPWP